MKKHKKETILPYLEKLQAEKLAEMGGYLRHLRQEQCLSLEEVAAKTKVQARLLGAIEEGKLEPLPEPVYIKGFIKRYADALGLNGEEFASVFPAGQSFQLLKPSWRDLPTAQLKPIHLYLMYVFLIVCAVNGLSNFVNRSSTQASSVATTTKPAALAGPPSPTNKPKVERERSPEAAIAAETITPVTTNLTPTNEPLRVGVTLKAESWIRVTADGKKEFEGVLPEGSQRTWVAKEELVVRAGNAGGVIVALNEGQAKQLGAPGTVREVTCQPGSPECIPKR